VGTLKRIAPIFAVRDVTVSLTYYRSLGFQTREYEGGRYGFVTRDGIEFHVGELPDFDARTNRTSAYLWVDDADDVAQQWRAAGADVRPPEDTEWGQHEGVLIDPDGNMIRFGSPIKR
jgi:predicted enzyme related to lactoylglutathione lyase